jgi:hypothetical protein
MMRLLGLWICDSLQASGTTTASLPTSRSPLSPVSFHWSHSSYLILRQSHLSAIRFSAVLRISPARWIASGHTDIFLCIKFTVVHGHISPTLIDKHEFHSWMATCIAPIWFEIEDCFCLLRLAKRRRHDRRRCLTA